MFPEFIWNFYKSITESNSPNDKEGNTLNNQITEDETLINVGKEARAHWKANPLRFHAEPNRWLENEV